jgi:hypothetical protein
MIVNEILNDLNTAFFLLSSVPVSGDAVDAMAAARAKLRGIAAELKRLAEQEGETDER